jgi:putative transposase
MRFESSSFGALLKPVDRRAFKAAVERHDGDRYGKSFSSWDHLVALVYAQLTGASSLRELELDWNAHSHRHYHLGSDRLSRSTLADANGRRPWQVFAETMTGLAAQCSGKTGRESQAMLRIIDSTPVPLGALYDCGASNGRIDGLKMHVVYDPVAIRPLSAEVTRANVNDVEIGCGVELAADTTYIFDKGYCSFAWWRQIADTAAFFVTRPKSNMKWRTLRRRRDGEGEVGDGFKILRDAEVKLVSKGDSKLPMPLRLIKVKRKAAKTIAILTNDMTRSAAEIAALYKGRWQIELLFRWLKQHLKIRRFMGYTENAIRLQLIAAIIAFLLMRIAARLNQIKMPLLRFAELIKRNTFSARPLARLDRPPEGSTAKKAASHYAIQFEFAYE